MHARDRMKRLFAASSGGSASEAARCVTPTLPRSGTGQLPFSSSFPNKLKTSGGPLFEKEGCMFVNLTSRVADITKGHICLSDNEIDLMICLLKVFAGSV